MAKPEKAAAAASHRFRHAGLEQLMARPAGDRSLLTDLLTDRDHNVVATAAIAIARQGDAKAAPYLIAAIKDDDLILPARCAAVEALGLLPGSDQVETLRRLADNYGQFTPGASAGYQVDLHAELLRALARHVDAADDPRFIAAAQVPSPLVRIETLRAWAAGTRGILPDEIIDLRSDDDPRVRMAAVNMLAARKPPAACEDLKAALHDLDLSVRLAAARGLGRLDDAESRAVLAELLKDRSELMRAEALAATAPPTVRGQWCLAQAGDTSWRVRLKVAEALTGYGDLDGAAAARRMLDDPSAEVERQVVRSLTAWPWEIAGPVVLDALSKDAVSVRKLAAEQLTARWPAAGRFPFDASPQRRAEVLSKLQTRYQQEFTNPQVTGGTSLSPGEGRVLVSDAQVERLLVAGDVQALAGIGPAVVDALERLAIDRKLTLPEPVYHDVLPRFRPAFAALDRMHSANIDQRRQGSRRVGNGGRQADLEPARRGPLVRAHNRRAFDRRVGCDCLAQRLDAVRASGSEQRCGWPAALEEAAAEVRRRACEYLAAHPDRAHEDFLVPLLSDPDREVVVAAIRALAAADQIRDIGVLKRQVAAADEEVQLEAAVGLVHFGDLSGEEAIERLSYSGDIKTRTRVAQALGPLGDARLTGILIRLLDDPRATVSHAALASLPKVVGRDVGRDDGRGGDAATGSMSDQVARWKKWYAETAK